MKVNINQRIEYLKKTVLLIAMLSFVATALTNINYPNLVPNVALLCLVPFTLMFGWCIGLMDAQRNAEL